MGDLRRLLSSSRNGNKLQTLSEDGFHTILESIYRIIRTDRTAYLNQLASGTKTVTSANRLTSAATALRLTVEAGCPRLKHKSVLSILDHIISTLPTAEDTFIEPLRSDYLKCFKIVLEHGPHGEHLRPKKWQELVDFVLVGIAISVGDDHADSANGSTRNPSARSAMSVSFRTSQTSTQKSSRNAAGNVIDDLLGSLRALSAITNMPLIERASEICDLVVDCLVTVPRAQELALETFNNVALVLLTENLPLLQAKVESLVRVYRHLWTSKSSATLREQVLVSLYSLRPLLLADSTALASIEPELKQQLLSTLLTEYAGRSAKDMLQFDDIVLPLSKQTPGGKPSHDFVVISESPTAMANWTLLEVVATLVIGLLPEHQNRDSDLGEDDLPRKRRKVELPVHAIVTQALNSRGGQKLAALQVLFFLMSPLFRVEDEIGPSIGDFAPLLLEEDHNISNWAMLLFTKLVRSSAWCKFVSFETWRLLLEAARRSVSTSAKSRAACMLIDAILQQSVEDTGLEINALREAFISGGKSGPVIFTDAALLMFTTAFTSNILDQESVFEAAASRLIEWLKLHWTLPESLDRVHNAHLAFHAQPELLCRLFAAVVGSDLRAIITYHHGEPLPLVRARAVIDELEPFVSYLENAGVSADKHDNVNSIPSTVRQLSSETLFRLQSNISDLLLSKMEEFKQVWDGYAAGRLTGSSNDVAAIVTSAFIVARLSSSFMISNASLSLAVKESTLGLWKLIEKSLQKATEASSRLAVVAAKLLRIRDDSRSTQFPIAKALSIYASFWVRAIWKSIHGDGDEDRGDSDVDMMESMDSRTSQRSKTSQDVTELGASRRDLISTATSRLSLPSLRLDLLVEAAKAQSNGVVNTQETSKIVNEMADLDGQDLLNARNSVLDFLDLEPVLGRADAAKILKVTASKCLEEYNFERNEVALCFLTKLMARLAPMWTNAAEDDELTGYASDIYGWLIGTILAKNAASQNLKVSIASMLDVAAHIPPSVVGDDLPSPRTSLLGLLRHSPNLVKFRLSPLLVHLFNRYILTEHEAIFGDIVENLPSDLDNLEGVAVRFYLLGRAWSQMVYYPSQSNLSSL